MPQTNRRAFLDADHAITIREEPIPEPGAGEVLVRVLANGICGSDIHFFVDGRLGHYVVTKPYVPGHEACGEIAGVGDGVEGWTIGDRVVIEPGVPCGRCRYCRSGRYNLCPDVVFLSEPPINGTFCDYLAIRGDSVHAMPASMSTAQGALVEPVAVAVQAVNRGRIRNGADGLVLGCGPIGLLTLQAFRAAGGGRVVGVDPMAFRLDKARELGADAVYTPDDSEAFADSADFVFETAGSDAATGQAFHCARPGGTVVQVGWPPANTVPLDVGRFMMKELDYVSVNRYANAFPTAIQWVSDGRVQTDPLVTHRFKLDDVAEAFRFAHDHAAEVIKVLVES